MQIWKHYPYIAALVYSKLNASSFQAASAKVHKSSAVKINNIQYI